jgi:hypothetical protein
LSPIFDLLRSDQNVEARASLRFGKAATSRQSKAAGRSGNEAMAIQDRAKTIETKQTEIGLHRNQRRPRVDFDQLLGIIQLNMFDCKQGPVEQ